MQSQTAEAHVYPAPLSFLDEELEPWLRVRLDEAARAEARAELEYVAAPAVMAVLAMLVVPAVRTVLQRMGCDETSATLCAIVTIGLLLLALSAKLLLGLFRGRNAALRFLARTVTGIASGATAGVLVLHHFSFLWCGASIVAAPVLCVAVLSRCLPDYALARLAWIERDEGTSAIDELYDGRVPLSARAAWALSSWAVRSEILRRTP